MTYFRNNDSQEAHPTVLMQQLSSNSEIPDWFEASIAALISCTNSSNPLRLEQLAGGANNRVYRAECDGKTCVVKWYFTDPEDAHDRFHAEWSFLSFAKQHGIDEVPTPIACDTTRRLAAFEFIAGRRPTVTDLGIEQIKAALAFFQKLNLHRSGSDAGKLPLGAEACFSIEQHLTCVADRVDRLQRVAITDLGVSVSVPTVQRIQHELQSLWHYIADRIKKQALEQHWSLADEIPISQRVISPSDFGFHNALLEPSGRVRFIDFEYAGWDDPAKTICDFFCQLAVPVPIVYWQIFCEALTQLELKSAAPRAEMLLPVYRLKWCCIVLNPLLRLGRMRRAFSGHLDPQSETYIAEHCLEKAEGLLSQLRMDLEAL